MGLSEVAPQHFLHEFLDVNSISHTFEVHSLMRVWFTSASHAAGSEVSHSTWEGREDAQEFDGWIPMDVVLVRWVCEGRGSIHTYHDQEMSYIYVMSHRQSQLWRSLSDSMPLWTIQA